MKEYIEREVALNELKEELEMNTPMCTEEQNHFIDLGLKIAIKDIERLPSADVVEVVRCKDCANSKHWYADKRMCFLWNESGIGVFENDFCSYGEKR